MSARKIVITLVLLVLAGAGVTLAVQQLRPPDRAIPTTRVAVGTVSLSVETDGELRAPKSAMLVAPAVGGTLQLVRLAAGGAPVKAGDVVFELDPSEQEYNLEQSQSEVLQADQEITRLKADTAVQQAQDQVSLLQARFAVRRAELDMKGNELLSAIDAQKNAIALDEARRRLQQLETDVASHRASNDAALAVLEERRNKARLSMDVARRNIESMKVTSPIDGRVIVKENMDAASGIFYTGMTLPEYRQGDMVSPGRMVAQVVDLGDLEVGARVPETDSANIAADQPVEIVIDATGGRRLSGRVKALGGMGSRRFFDMSARRMFDVSFRLDEVDEGLRPGLSVKVLIAGRELKDVRYLPRQAAFDKDGKTVVYVRGGSGFEAREAKVTHRTATHVVVENLEPGLEVALVNPETAAQAGQAGPAAGPAALQRQGR